MGAYRRARQENYPVSHSVRVSNLEGDDDLQPEHLYEHFQFCGKVQRVTIKINSVTGKRLGHAFVDFVDPAGAENALALDGAPFVGDREIKVEKKKAEPRMLPRGNNKGGGKGCFGKGFSKGGKQYWHGPGGK